MDPLGSISERNEPEACAGTSLPPISEQLLQRINELEASHAHLKEEMSKLLGCNTPRLEEGSKLDSSLAAEPRPLLHSSTSENFRRSSAQDRARHASVHHRGQRLPPSGQRSHSVSPQRTRMATSRRSSFDARQRRGQNLPHRHQASPLQQECSSSQSGQREVPEGKFSSELTERHYINILQSLGQAVHIFKPTGEITYWNHFAELLYGYSALEAVGQNAIELLVDENNFDVANSIVDRITVGESWKGQFPLKKKSGELFSAVMSNTPFYGDDGTFVGVICVSTDAHPFREPAGAFNESCDQWQKSNDTVKSKFEHLQIPIASKLSNLASKVSSKVRSRIRIGENSVEHEGGSGGSQCSDHGYPEFGRISDEKGCGDATSSGASTPRAGSAPGQSGISPPSSPSEKSRNKVRFEALDENDGKNGIPNIKAIGSKAEAWMAKKGISWPWKGAERDGGEGKTRFMWPRIHSDREKEVGLQGRNHIGGRRESYSADGHHSSEVLGSWSSTNINSTSSNSSSSSTSSSAVQKLEMDADSLDYEILWEDLKIGEQIGQGNLLYSYFPSQI